jgi:hypothetical protein
MSHRRPAAMAQFGRTSTTVGAPFGGAPAPKITSVAMVQAGALPQVTNWHEGLWSSGSTVAGDNGEGGSVWWQNTRGGPLFIGGFRSLCSQGGFQPNPSLHGLKSTKFGDKINWG